MAKVQGSGSVWNVNSWHWEAKNYSQISKQMIEQKFLDTVFEPSKELKIRHTNVKFIKSESEINIRKGKQIVLYDFEIELTVTGDHQSEDNSEGSYKLREVMNDNLDDMIVEEIKATEKNTVATQMKAWLKKNVKDQIVKMFLEYETQIKSIESDPKKLEEDKKKREELLSAVQKAKEEKGAEKERLLEEQRQKQRLAKEQAYRVTLEKRKAQSK